MRTTARKIAIAAACGLALVGVTDITAFAAPPANPSATLNSSVSNDARTSAEYLTAEETKTVELINHEREIHRYRPGHHHHHCPSPLLVDARLTASARAHSKDMADRRYTAHNTPDGITPQQRVTDAGYSPYAGENLAWGYGDSAAVVNDWVYHDEAQQNGHRKNIWNCEAHTVGVGVYKGGPERIYWTVDFGG